MSDMGLVARLDHMVRAAKEQVTLYRLMYADRAGVDSLESFADLPILTIPMLATERLVDTLADPGQICISRTFIDHGHHKAYMPRLLSYEDVVREYDVLSFITEFAGLSGQHKILLIADERHAYTIAELGKYLAFYGWPLATFIGPAQRQDDLKAHLKWFKPTAVFVDSESDPPADLLPRSVRLLFTFNKPGWPHKSVLPYDTYDLFRDPWVGLAAIKFEKDDHYTFNPRHYYFESEPGGALLITSFVNSLQPVIRYRPGCCGVVTGAGTFILGEVRA
jgi:hypothetical protein